MKGIVYLVGAGPGDRGLLTLKGLEKIKVADVIVYDRLISPEILAEIPEGAEKIDVGKTAGHHPIKQEKINEILLEQAQLGKQVVRLKGGDPFLFGRGGEELELLVENNIPFEVIPGVTSAIAASAYAGIPVTHRNYASSLHIITGHQKNGILDIDYESLVKLKGTLIFMMSLSTAKEIQEGLIGAGMPSEMPLMIVERGTWKNQKKWFGHLAGLTNLIEVEKIESPAILIVGLVCELGEKFDWYSKKPLEGKRILVTRPVSTNGRLAKGLDELGAEVVLYPCIETQSIDFSIDLTQSDWILFTSAVGVRVFFHKLNSEKKDSRALSNIKIAVVGPETEKEIEKYGIFADFVPSVYDGYHLARELIESGKVKETERITLYRAQLGAESLSEELKNAGYEVQDISVYKTLYVSQKKINLNDFDLVTFTSASCVKGFSEIHHATDLSQITAICIGNQTGQAALQHNMKVVCSDVATIPSMIEKILEVSNGKEI